MFRIIVSHNWPKVEIGHRIEPLRAVSWLRPILAFFKISDFVMWVDRTPIVKDADPIMNHFNRTLICSPAQAQQLRARFPSLQ
jgi:hypothetical protein